jgi:hypothetical protein
MRRGIIGLRFETPPFWGGFVLELAVCDQTAGNLARFSPQDILITESTWHYNGGGCC